MTLDGIYEELCPCASRMAKLDLKMDLGFIWGDIETEDLLRLLPTLSLRGIGQVHVPIAKEVIVLSKYSSLIYVDLSVF